MDLPQDDFGRAAVATIKRAPSRQGLQDAGIRSGGHRLDAESSTRPAST